MGLLDALSDPTVSHGLLGLAAGMLNPTGTYGRFGASLGNGLLGFQQGEEQAQNMAMKKQQIDALNQYKALQGQQLQMAMDQQRFRNQMGAWLMGGAMPAAPATTGAASGAAPSMALPMAGGAQTFPVPGQTQSGQPQATPPMIAPGIRQAALADLVFNGGKGIAELIKPNIQNVRPGGTVFDASGNKILFSAPTTNGTQVVYGPNGPAMNLLPGAAQAESVMSTAKARGPAEFRTQTVNKEDGSNILTTDAAIHDQVLPAPLRNNNPGALMPGGKLASYPTMEAGLQGLDDNLSRYGQQGINTLSGVISKWAPPNENDTQAYIKDVSGRLGISPAQKIDLSNPVVRQALSTAIAIHENGVNGVFGTAQQAPAMPGIPVQGEGTIATNQALGKGQAQLLLDSRKSAINATDDLTNINQARQALSGGTFGGSGAQAKLNAVKFMQSWVPGLENLDANKVTNTDYLVSTLGKSLLTHAKDLGYNPTDTDATRVEAIIGTIGKDPQALNKLLDYQEMMANRAIQRHNALVGQAGKSGVQSALDMSVSPATGMPAPTEPAASLSGFKIVGVR